MESKHYIESPVLGQILTSGIGNNSYCSVTYSFKKETNILVKCTIISELIPNETFSKYGQSFLTKINFKGIIIIEAIDDIENPIAHYINSVIPYNAFTETIGLEIVFNDYHAIHLNSDSSQISVNSLVGSLYSIIYPLLVIIKQKSLDSDIIDLINISGKNLLDYIFDLHNA